MRDTEILLLGTGDRVEKMPSALRQYLNKVGVQVDIMNTVSSAMMACPRRGILRSTQRNACSTYNLLAEEGRRVAAALLPPTPQTWK